MAPLNLRRSLSTQLGPWALGHLGRLAQAPWLWRTWPGRAAWARYQAARRCLSALGGHYAPLVAWACLGRRALAYLWHRPPLLLY